LPAPARPEGHSRVGAQARAAAARILAKIARGHIETEAIFAEVHPDRCSGCRMCNEVCPYSAITYAEAERRSQVVSALCKGCGTCVATCPAAAIEGRHFTDAQIYAQIRGVLQWDSSHASSASCATGAPTPAPISPAPAG